MLFGKLIFFIVKDSVFLRLDSTEAELDILFPYLIKVGVIKPDRRFRNCIALINIGTNDGINKGYIN